jgi:hypothetical protein
LRRGLDISSCAGMEKTYGVNFRPEDADDRDMALSGQAEI